LLELSCVETLKKVLGIMGLLVVLAIAAAASGHSANVEADDERATQRNAVGKGAIHDHDQPQGILPLLDYSGVVAVRADG
jgi:hypothetical protein